MSTTTYMTDPVSLGTGLLLGRLILGALMVGHGTQKLFGWFGGYGIAGTAGYFEQLGFRPGRLFVITAAFSEVASGILIALGLLGPIGPALLLSVMIVAAISVHWKNGVFATANGIEVPLLYATGAIALAFTGFGPFALDTALGIDHAWTPELKVAALAVGVVGGVVNLLARRPAAVAATA
jgi:putative oxidoreductase